MNCNKCNTELVVGNNLSIGCFNRKDFICKSCLNKRYAAYRNKNRHIMREASKKHQRKLVDDHYSVYLLPKHNYVGQTNSIKKRMHRHKNYGRDISDYQVLHTFSTRKEALLKEAEYHSRGYKGENRGI